MISRGQQLLTLSHIICLLDDIRPSFAGQCSLYITDEIALTVNEAGGRICGDAVLLKEHITVFIHQIGIEEVILIKKTGNFVLALLV